MKKPLAYFFLLPLFHIGLPSLASNFACGWVAKELVLEKFKCSQLGDVASARLNFFFLQSWSRAILHRTDYTEIVTPPTSWLQLSSTSI